MSDNCSTLAFSEESVRPAVASVSKQEDSLTHQGGCHTRKDRLLSCARNTIINWSKWPLGSGTI